MTPVPLELPLRPAEAAEVANLIFDQAERKPLSDEVRNRIAARGSVLRLASLRPYFGSLERDPIHPSSYYLAVDGQNGEPLLLHCALATAPTSGVFHKPLLIGRMRRPNGPEMVLNAVAFGPADQENLEKFAASVAASFDPRAGSSRTIVAVTGGLTDAFDGFRAALRRTGKNVAGVAVASGLDARRVFCEAVWCAIRAGWREGYSAALDVQAAESLESARERVRSGGAFSLYGFDTAQFVEHRADRRHEKAWSDAEAEEQFERRFTAEERGWIFDEFGRGFELAEAVYDFPAPELVRLAVKFGRCLEVHQQLREFVRQTRSAAKSARSFECELQFPENGAATSPLELMFCLHWLKARGHAAHWARPCLAGSKGLEEHLASLVAIARHFQCGISMQSRSDHDAAALDAISRITAGRVYYLVSGDATGRIPEIAEHLLG